MNDFCIVPVCPNSEEDFGVEHFKVPIGFKRRRWLEAIGRPDLIPTGEEPNKTLFICERHFFSHMIYSDKANTKHLQFSAFPILNLPRSNTYKRKEKTESKTLNIHSTVNNYSKIKTTNPKTHVASRLYGVPYIVTEAPSPTSVTKPIVTETPRPTSVTKPTITEAPRPTSVTKPMIAYNNLTLNNKITLAVQTINHAQETLKIIKTEPESIPEGSRNVYDHLIDIEMTKIKTEETTLDVIANDIIKVDDPMGNEEYRISFIEEPQIEIKEENIKHEIDEQVNDIEDNNTINSVDVDISDSNNTNVRGFCQDLERREEAHGSGSISPDVESDSSEEEKQTGGPRYEPQRLGRVARLLLRDEPPPAAAPAPQQQQPPGTGEQWPQHLFHFEWRKLTFPRSLETDYKSRQKEENPASRQELLQVPTKKSKDPISPLEAFTAIWDNKFLEQVAKWTNRRAERVLARRKRGRSSHMHVRYTWKRPTPVGAADIRVYFAILMAMGMCPKKTIKSYFRPGESITGTPNFIKYMCYTKFLLFGRFISFSDEGDIKTGMTKEELQHVRFENLLNHLNEKFQSLHEMDSGLVIDQYLLSGYPECEYSPPQPRTPIWSDASHFNVVEAYAVCEACTGYMYRFHVSVKKGDTEDEEASETDTGTGSSAIVLNLLSGLKHKGYSVYMDSGVCSPALARVLKSEGFDCVGVVSRSRDSLPQEVTQLRAGDLDRGAVVGWTCGDLDLIAWSECGRLLTMISTYHSIQLGITRLGQTKPLVFLDYSICMEAMDRTDLSLASYPTQRQCASVYKKLFRRLLNISILNAYVIYRRSSGHLNHHEFREALIEEILAPSLFQ